jgi:indolepyruvate ferredoxin oxidoreductase
MILDMSGLAQKGGAVLSHVRLSHSPADVTCSRIVTGTCDLLIAADEVMAISKETLTLCERGRTHGVVNTHLIPIADFIRSRDFDFQQGKVNRVLQNALRPDSGFLDFTHIAESLLGDAIATNMMMLGYAYQRGLLPLAGDAIEQAISLNGVAVKMNTNAFRLGRLAAADPARLAALVKDETAPPKVLADMSLDEVVAHRSRLLAAYQNERLAARYRALVAKVGDAAANHGLGEELPRAVAINYAKLLAYKDEYEVARLFTDGGFAKQLHDQFEGDFKLSFHLAPPMLPGKDTSGRPRKRTFGPWTMTLFQVLARLKGLRGTPFDPFGYGAERRMERGLIAAYEADVAEVLRLLSPRSYAAARDLLALPDMIRGYGPIKHKAVEDARARHAQLIAQLRDPPPLARPQIAAE